MGEGVEAVALTRCHEWHRVQPLRRRQDADWRVFQGRIVASSSRLLRVPRAPPLRIHRLAGEQVARAVAGGAAVEEVAVVAGLAVLVRRRGLARVFGVVECFRRRIVRGQVRQVVCACDAKRLYLEMLPEDVVPKELRKRLPGMKTTPGFFQVQLGVDMDLEPYRDQIKRLNFIYPYPDIDKAMANFPNGNVEEAAYYLYVATFHQPEMAPPGQHSLKLECPTRLDSKGIDWDRDKEQVELMDFTETTWTPLPRPRAGSSLVRINYSRKPAREFASEDEYEAWFNDGAGKGERWRRRAAGDIPTADYPE